MTTRARLQIIIGVLIAVSSALIYTYYKPFVEAEDNLVSSVAQYQIFFVLLAALMSLISSSEYVAEDAKAGDLYSDILFGWLLVIANLIGPGIASAMLLRERLMAVRENMVELLGLRQGVIDEREGDVDGKDAATAASHAMPLSESERDGNASSMVRLPVEFDEPEPNLPGPPPTGAAADADASDDNEELGLHLSVVEDPAVVSAVDITLCCR